MDTRAAIDSLLDKAYAARRTHDAHGASALFTDDGRFMANGAPAATKNRTEQVTALKGMFDAFAVIGFREHCRIIDPPRAVVALAWRVPHEERAGRGYRCPRPVRGAGRQDRLADHASSTPPTQPRSPAVRRPVNRPRGFFCGGIVAPLPRKFNYSFMTPTAARLGRSTKSGRGLLSRCHPPSALLASRFYGRKARPARPCCASECSLALHLAALAILLATESRLVPARGVPAVPGGCSISGC